MGRGDVISTFFYKHLIEQCGAGCLPVSKARIMTLTYKLCPTAQGDSPQHEVYEKSRDKKAIQTDNKTTVISPFCLIMRCQTHYRIHPSAYKACPAELIIAISLIASTFAILLTFRFIDVFHFCARIFNE
ncbi:TPA: hypothetical protein ACW7MX_004632 [Enterobacter ludwigii]|uniref:hypothetical protein n=1 Tax=Enterobacter TaxID=547 RepID=UPI001651FCC7|nr:MULTISPECIES: hypothetical protein [Enterobacter]MBT1849392.1 hypothetical protein [Enterobacter ludwigii]USX30849.1 hypothetical protein NHG68_18160 [Enterobacter sp. Z1]